MESKVCTACKEEKSTDQFSKSGYHPSGRPKVKSRCKDCIKIIDSDYTSREEVREKSKARSRNRHQDYMPIREKFYNFLKENPCVDCGEDDILFLECDHVRGVKTMSIGKMMTRYRPWEEIEEEIKKCEVRCLKCHRIATATRAGWSILNFR